MYNRYVGNTGKRYIVEESPASPPQATKRTPPQPVGTPAKAPSAPEPKPSGGLSGLLGSLGSFGGLGRLGRLGGLLKKPAFLGSGSGSFLKSLPFGLSTGDLMVLLLLLLQEHLMVMDML